MNRYTPFAKFALLAVLAGFGLLLAGLPLTAQKEGTRTKAKVYVYPHKLTANDKLSFGQDEEQKGLIPIKGETTLIYVDLAPDARFAHPTQCILISAGGARVIDGQWWLVLNGQPLFRDGKTTQVNSPVLLSGK
jgi:hypothetical protein